METSIKSKKFGNSELKILSKSIRDVKSKMKYICSYSSCEWVNTTL